MIEVITRELEFESYKVNFCSKYKKKTKYKSVTIKVSSKTKKK